MAEVSEIIICEREYDLLNGERIKLTIFQCGHSKSVRWKNGGPFRTMVNERFLAIIKKYQYDVDGLFAWLA